MDKMKECAALHERFNKFHGKRWRFDYAVIRGSSYTTEHTRVWKYLLAHGIDHKDIAEYVHVSPQTVKSRLLKDDDIHIPRNKLLKQKLAAQLKEEYIEWETTTGLMESDDLIHEADTYCPWNQVDWLLLQEEYQS